MTSHMAFNHYVHDADFQISIDPFLLDQDLSHQRKPSMNNNLFNIPLSPPSSPRLSQFQQEPENSWQNQHSQQLQMDQDSSDHKMSLLQTEMQPSLTLDTKPMLHSHQSLQYSTQRTSGTIVPTDTPSLHDGDSPSTIGDDLNTPNLGDLSSSDMPQVAFGDSVPSSPLSSFAPQSPLKDEDDELTGLGISMGESDDEKKPMTAAEIRAHKRKMKRFRLTHNQTRFLMSEFARQAHPDAAHRERLAREIPGLTPRQVQVWFQNRRAKLKRLTSDDRERMMRSRALPDDFDMTQALHSPFGAIQNVNSTLSSPGGFSTISDSNIVRPLSLESLRRIPDGPHHMSPIPGYGGFNFTPPQSVTDGLSPISPAGGDSPFGYSPSIDGQRRSNPFGGPLTSPNAFTSHPQMPRLHMHDRDGRRQEGLTSPLRPTISFQSHGDMNPGSPLGHHADTSGPPSMIPYGLTGYSYPTTMSGFATSTDSRMGPNGQSRPHSTRPQYSPTPRPTQSPFLGSMSMMQSPHVFSNPFLKPGSPLERHVEQGEEVCA